MKLEKDYEPFGPEWEKTMMKLPKKFIIDQYRRACEKLIVLEARVKSPKP